MDAGDGLDPADWSTLRALGHRMMDDMIDHMEGLRGQPVWRPMPGEVRAALRAPLPRAPSDPAIAYDAFRRLVLPYAAGNAHPRFMGWVQGAGTPIGMLAELLAGGMNANCGGRDHAAIEVERQVIRWSAEMLGFPIDAGGLLVTGTSAANLMAVLVARTAALGPAVRASGLGGAPLVAYASAAVHGCVPRALDMAGLGADALRTIACDGAGRIDMAALARAIRDDRTAGLTPFMVVGTAGSVDIGAIDPLASLAALCRRERLWFHIDAAFGAIAMLAPGLRGRFAGIGQADSVAFDFHKWAQVPYDAGCIMVRDPARQIGTFASGAAYLRRGPRGLAGGHPWPCDLGPDLSRGFRALKVWLTFTCYGGDRIGAAAERCCAVAQALAARVDREPELERLAPVALNIVCFRYVADMAMTDLSAEIVADIQEAGIAAPSTTLIGGVSAIRAAVINHRTRVGDVEAMADAVLAAGRARTGWMGSAD
jgi:glutamate/tyrosine decarboxylase-like PLP-dependent enzyme